MAAAAAAANESSIDAAFLRELKDIFTVKYHVSTLILTDESYITDAPTHTNRKPWALVSW